MAQRTNAGAIRWQTVVLLLCLAALAGAMLAAGMLDRPTVWSSAGRYSPPTSGWYSLSAGERLKVLGSGLRK